MPTPLDYLFNSSRTLALLGKTTAPMVLGFMQEAFKKTDRQVVEEGVLESVLVQHLEGRDLTEGETDADPHARARALLNQWCSDSCCYLSKFFSEQHQCYVYQLTRHSEKALQWVREMQTGERSGHATAESRFTRIVGELEVLSRRTEEDPKARLADLLAQRDALDAEIVSIRQTGKVQTLTPAQIKDRLMDLAQMQDAFLADFRAIEDNFAEHAKEIRELYLSRSFSKGDIIAHALDADAKLRNSEQGVSYYGFLARLRSREQRESLEMLLDDAAKLAIEAGVDSTVFSTLLERLFREVGVVQGGYTKISSSLRRVVEEVVASDSRQIMEWIAEIKQRAVALRETDPPDGAFVEIDGGIAWSNLMEVEFYEAKASTKFQPVEVADPNGGEEELQKAFRGIGKPFDMGVYQRRVREALKDRDQITLPQLLEIYPLQNGAIDIVGYLAVASEDKRHLVDQANLEEINLERPGHPRLARLGRIIFHKR